MLIGVQADPDELAELTPEQIGEKLVGAFGAAASQLFKAKAALGGEVRALEELKVALTKGFEEELARVRAEILTEVSA